MASRAWGMLIWLLFLLLIIALSFYRFPESSPPSLGKRLFSFRTPIFSRSNLRMRGALRKKREDIPMKRFQAILLKQNIAVTEPVFEGNRGQIRGGTLKSVLSYIEKQDAKCVLLSCFCT
jgi:hypothetical protein